jgi:hypothetical protein
MSLGLPMSLIVNAVSRSADRSTPSRSRPKFNSGCSSLKKIAHFSMSLLP